MHTLVLIVLMALMRLAWAGEEAAALSDSSAAPQSDAEAVRFLQRATFGASPADVAELRRVGYRGWLDAQMAIPPSLQRPSVEAAIAAHVQIDPRGPQFYRGFRVDQWFRTQLEAPDALRQKVAYALSQILVVSDVGVLAPHVQAVAEYNDVLLRNAFGSYRALLSEVTHSPAMGLFLSHLRNRKTDWTMVGGVLAPGAIAPDENYAREVMQLFSIGLVERGDDFSPLRDGDGATIATYDQAVVTQTARALTGLSLSCSGIAEVGGLTIARNCGCSGDACNFSERLFAAALPRWQADGKATGLAHPDSYAPMVCYPRFADTGRSAARADGYAVLPAPDDRKTVLAGIEIPASPVACHAGTPAKDRHACIAYCEDQIATVLDALVAHPNVAPFVSRQLIQRLVTSNPSPAYIQRVAAVFADDGDGQRGNLGAVVRALLLDPEALAPAAAPGDGKLREPLLRLLAIWRAFDARPGGSGEVGLNAPETVYAQRPLGAATVFNFYEPDYQPPGALQEAGLFAPELQIVHESSVVSAADDLWLRVHVGYVSDRRGNTAFVAPARQAYLPPEAIDALPAGDAELVEALNQRLLYGTMSADMRAILLDWLAQDMSRADHRRKALDLIHLIAISPEFAVQR